MEHKELVEKLKKLKSDGYSKSEIERDLMMPKNSISGFMSGKKKLPAKWVKLLEEYKTPAQRQLESLIPEIPTMVKSMTEKYSQLPDFLKPDTESYDAPKLSPEVKDENGQWPTFKDSPNEWAVKKYTEQGFFDPIAMAKQMKRLEALDKIESYCSEVGIEPEELIFIHRKFKDNADKTNATFTDAYNAAKEMTPEERKNLFEALKKPIPAKQTYDPYKDPTFLKKNGLK